jgi:hypothetical protein
MPRGKYAHEIVKAWVTGEGAGSHINGAIRFEQTPVVDTFFSHKMIFKSKLLPLLVLSLGTSCVGHDGHDKDQMPMDYVRFPYQATYPGDDSGQSVLSSRASTCAQFFDDCFRISHG